MNTPPLIRSERRGATAILTLDLPARRNALSLDLRAELERALAAAMDDPACRVVVLTGAGGHFCSGGDISGMDGVAATDAIGRLVGGHAIIRTLVEGPKPVIAAVEGHGAGAGLSLAAACDVVVAGRGAIFTCSFNRIGLVPDLGLAFTLPLRVGTGRARRMMLTAEPVDAETAERWGLAEAVVQDGTALEAALALADRVALAAPLSNAYAKRLLGRMPTGLDDILKAEADAQAVLYTTADFAEGRAAFREKRKPLFEGR